MNKQPPKIVLTGAGSGGHITPLLSLAHALKSVNPKCQLTYIGFKGDNFDSLKLSSKDLDSMAFIQAGKFRRYHGESLLSHLFDAKTIALNLRDFFRVLRAIGSSYKILGRVKPDLVFSKGSFVAVPVGIAAKLRGIPIITHDSDAMPGLANRIVGRWAVLHTTGMPIDNYSYPASKTHFVGIPLAKEVKPVSPAAQRRYKQQIGLPADSLVLLVGSGGNGSRTVNQLVLKASPALLSSNTDLHIINVAGQKNAEQLEKEYGAILDKVLRQRVTVLGFVNDFYKYSGAADLIIGRAGATTLSEFATQKKACIIIPSPFLANGHQMKNAAELERLDAAAILPDEAEPDELTGLVNELIGDVARRTELGQNLNKLAVANSAEKIAKMILEVIDSRRV